MNERERVSKNCAQREIGSKFGELVLIQIFKKFLEKLKGVYSLMTFIGVCTCLANATSLLTGATCSHPKEREILIIYSTFHFTYFA